MIFRKLDLSNKNNKLLYYIRAVIKTKLIPASFFRKQLNKKLACSGRSDFEYILKRVNYHNKLSVNLTFKTNGLRLGDIKLPERRRVYHFDSQEYFRFFDKSLQVFFHWGDVTFVPDEPAIVKSRPLVPGNSNSVILNLDKARHFNFIKDFKSFVSKKDMLIGRAQVTQPHRIRFYEQYFEHPMCDLGQINNNMNPGWVKNKLTISEHLDYKFILSLEGNDVATNLKWIMSSNSLAVMPTPKFETWFMEATLIPDYHYVHIKDDLSDLEEKLNYYKLHTEEALQIIKNANAYVRQFQDKEREDIIALLVLEKYFYRTGQLAPIDPSLFD